MASSTHGRRIGKWRHHIFHSNTEAHAAREAINSTPAASEVLLQQASTAQRLHSLPNQLHNWGPSIQAPELRAPFSFKPPHVTCHTQRPHTPCILTYTKPHIHITPHTHAYTHTHVHVHTTVAIRNRLGSSPIIALPRQ